MRFADDAMQRLHFQGWNAEFRQLVSVAGKFDRRRSQQLPVKKTLSTKIFQIGAIAQDGYLGAISVGFDDIGLAHEVSQSLSRKRMDAKHVDSPASFLVLPNYSKPRQYITCTRHVFKITVTVSFQPFLFITRHAQAIHQ